MIKFAPNISICNFEESKDLQHEVIWVFSKNLKGVSTTRHRLTIHVTRESSEELTSLSGSIKFIRKYVDIQQYLKRSDFEKKRFLLELITSCFLQICDDLNWSKNSILKAKEESLNQNIEFEYISKAIWNSSKEIKASVEIVLNNKKASIYILFISNKSSEPFRKHLIDTVFWNLSDGNSFNNPKWLDNLNFGFGFENDLTIRVSQNAIAGEWSKSSSKKDEYTKYMLNYNENFSQKELAKLANW